MSAQHDGAVVAANPDHLLVFVQGAVDVTPRTTACAGYQVYAGPAGQAATYPIRQLPTVSDL